MVDRLINLMEEERYFRYLIYVLMFPWAVAFDDFWEDKLFYQALVLIFQIFATYLYLIYTVRSDEE